MGFIKKPKAGYAIKRYLARAEKLQAENKLEDAYEQYEKAAELGSTDAMLQIAKMYFSGQFRPKESSNILELMMQGIPSFPWNTVNRKIPDYASALEWFRKAADLGHPVAACMAGSMLCEGTGCKTDKAAGRTYLETAAAAGIREAQNMRFLYRDHPKKDFTAEAYEDLLKQFSEAAEAGKDEAYALYDQLKGGEDRFLARLGYVLIAAQYSGKQTFLPFKPSQMDCGIPLLPVCNKRGAWRTFIRVDLNAFASDHVDIAFASDIDPDFTLGHSHRLTRCGSAVYRSPEFGWLGEEKHAVLFRIDRDALLREEELQTAKEQFWLVEEEYLQDNAAFFTECGEKEYSVEIAAISGGKVDVLCRYTVGGPDTVREYFEPKLLSVSIEE